jgi:hypothetical protein
MAVALLSALLAVLSVVVMPWHRELRAGVSLSQLGADVISEPRGLFLFRQFAGDALSQRAIYVHLNDPRITDQSLAQLRQFEHIEVLSIKSPNVTDEALAHLRHLSSLRSLNLVDTKVTESGVETLRQSLPHLRRIERRNSD